MNNIITDKITNENIFLKIYFTLYISKSTSMYDNVNFAINDYFELIQILYKKLIRFLN